jgi:hypothetical protein
METLGRHWEDEKAKEFRIKRKGEVGRNHSE